jgi:hypothetical protein
MDHLFSSPEKPASKRRANGVHKNANATISSEEDMDMGESMSSADGFCIHLLMIYQVQFQSQQQCSMLAKVPECLLHAPNPR